MKTITLKIEKEYLRTGSKDSDYDLLDSERNLLETSKLGTGFRIKSINYDTKEITEEKGRVFSSGQTYDISDDYYNNSFSFLMEDDGVICCEETLYLLIECFETALNQEQTVELPYRVGATLITKPHPYQVTVLETNNEEVLIEIKDETKTTTHLVQLHRGIERNDEYGYATGAPNDPWDTHGPKIYVSLMRK